jgi:hypothetical protein
MLTESLQWQRTHLSLLENSSDDLVRNRDESGSCSLIHTMQKEHI